MLFSSVSFLYGFLPVTLILYFAAPKRLKNTVLLICSLFFYFWGEPVYCLLLIFASLIGYVLGLFAGRARVCGVISVIISVFMLGFFKYSDFFIENFNALFGTAIPLTHVALPIGISFYTFQIMSYTIDVMRRDVPPRKSYIDFAAYMTMFPQLIAGPIVRYSDIYSELSERKTTLSGAAEGILRFTAGLCKKVIIANTLAAVGADFAQSDGVSVLYAWLCSVAYMLQIYYDFSGYSDMAIGLGKLFGFNFPENFNYPYISRSITEFWRRWHISLGSWFRDYVYIPLGGNRVSKPRQIFNIAVVWLLTGFWHGASWNFIIWGLYFAVLLVIEKLFLKRLLERAPKALQSVYVLLFVIISFVIFNCESMGEAAVRLSSMLGLYGTPAYTVEAVYELKSYLPIIIIAAFGATPVIKKLYGRLSASRAAPVLCPLLCAAGLAAATAFLIDGSFNPFLYFRF